MEIIIALFVIAGLPFGLIVWFVWSLVSVVKRYRKKEKPSWEQVVSLFFSALFLAGLTALIIYIIYIFSSGIPLM